MHILSLWQPWASAIALGLKQIETRSWATNYRGLLAIHSAVRPMRPSEIGYEMRLDLEAAHVQIGWDERPGQLLPVLPYGAIVCVAHLSEIEVTYCARQRRDFTFTEYRWGDYSPDRYAWRLDNVRPLRTPLPYRGGQGLRVLPEDVATQVLELADPAVAVHSSLVTPHSSLERSLT